MNYENAFESVGTLSVKGRQDFMTFSKELLITWVEKLE